MDSLGSLPPLTETVVSDEISFPTAASFLRELGTLFHWTSLFASLTMFTFS